MVTITVAQWPIKLHLSDCVLDENDDDDSAVVDRMYPSHHGFVGGDSTVRLVRMIQNQARGTTQNS